MRRLGLVALSAAAFLSACSSGVNGFAIVASSPGSVGVGEQRVVVAITDPETDQYLGAPDVEVVATLRDRIGSPIGEYPGEFAWIVPGVRGLYSFNMEIPGPGTFQITLKSDAFNEAGPVGLVTVEDPQVVAIGDEAPRSETRTTADQPLDDITSDPDPDPAFYELSVAEAVESGPSVIVFATPAWCTSQACGPLLDQVKTLSGEFPDLNYVHVEIYEDIHVQSFDQLTLVPSVVEWALPAEPWVFVTDSAGRVSASFEGVASEAELRAAFEVASNT